MLIKPDKPDKPIMPNTQIKQNKSDKQNMLIKRNNLINPDKYIKNDSRENSIAVCSRIAAVQPHAAVSQQFSRIQPYRNSSAYIRGFSSDITKREQLSAVLFSKLFVMVFVLFKSFLDGSSDGAGACAHTAFNADIGIDFIFAVTFGNCTYRAIRSTSAASDTSISNLISHFKFLLNQNIEQLRCSYNILSLNHDKSSG